MQNSFESSFTGPLVNFSIVSVIFSMRSMSGADLEILKRRGALCWPPWLADEEKFKVSDGLKRPK